MIIFISMTSFILGGWICYIVEIGMSHKCPTIKKNGQSVEFIFGFSPLIGLNAIQ